MNASDRPAHDRLADMVAGLDDDAATATSSAEADALERMWSALGNLVPSAPAGDPERRFASLLDAYRQGLEEGRGEARAGLARRPAAASWRQGGWIAAAAAAAALVVGIGLGRVGTAPDAELAGLQAEMRALSRNVAASLLAHGPASERLRGVSLARTAAAEDDAVLDALVTAVRSDPSTNVRVAAIEALGPLVRQRGALRTTLERELRLAAEAPSGERRAAPLVQIALVDSLLAAGDPGRQAVERLLDDLGERTLDPIVRNHIGRRLGRPATT